MAQPTKVDKFLKLAAVANEDYASTQDVARAFKTLADFIKDTKVSLQNAVKESDSSVKTQVLGCIKKIERIEQSMRQVLSENTKNNLQTLRSELKNEVGNVRKLIPTLPDAFDPTELQNQIDVLMEYETPKVEAEEVRDLLELLEGDERLDASAIKNLPDFVEKAQRVVSTSHALWNLMDVSIAGITAGQSIQWDGIKWVPFTPAGSGGTPIWGEDLTSQGPGTVYTLANTPVAGTVRVFRGGAYQQAGAGGDYTLSGSTITFNVSTQTGEIILCDYSYT